MSVEALAVVLHHSTAKGTDKLILIGVANHDGDGGAWPAIDTLARYANVSRRTAERSLAALVQLGELHIELRAGGKRDTPEHERPNLYTIRVACPPTCDGTVNHRPRRDTDGLEQPARVDVNPPTPTSGGAELDPPTPTSGVPLTLVSGGPPTPTSGEPSMNQHTPQPPASGGLEVPAIPGVTACPRHGANRVDGCRSCGTSARQVAEQQRKRAAEARRQREAAQRRAERDAAARTRVDSRAAAPAITQARAAIRGARP